MFNQNEIGILGAIFVMWWILVGVAMMLGGKKWAIVVIRWPLTKAFQLLDWLLCMLRRGVGKAFVAFGKWLGR